MRPVIGIPCQGNLRSRYRRFCTGQSYCRAVQLAGGTPILLPLLDDNTVLDAYLRLDGLLLAGGGDLAPRHYGEARQTNLTSVDPPRDRIELWLARQAMTDDLPLLAICRGIQVLNVAMGGTLYQDIATQLPRALRHNFRLERPRNYLAHEVRITPGTHLQDILGVQQLRVNSFHHQAVKRVAEDLQVTATAPDGVIEGLQAYDKRFVVAVQWHPEELIEDAPGMKRLFEAFASESRRTAQFR
jgi:putative glutamine amidotransferase